MQRAIKGLQLLLGAENVVIDDATLDDAGRNTYATERRPSLLARPASTEEVAEVVRWAGREKIALYPISRGFNWGYGSRVAPRDNVVLLDLSRMDRIIEVDDSLAWARVQAGVSFEGLSSSLASRDAPVMLGAIGGPPHSSLIGNLVERGLGKGAYGDRFLNACDLEVVLPDGEIMRTGFGAFDNARVAALQKTGLGPAVDGIFTQSSLGIVTAATFWLQRRTAHDVSAIFWTNDDRRVDRLVDSVRELKLEGTIRSTSLIANDIRRMSFLRQYPWDLTGGRTPLPHDVRTSLRQLGAWCGDFSLYGATAELVHAQRQRVQEKLGPIVDGMIFSDSTEGANEAARASVAAVHHLGSGRLLVGALSPVYWRMKSAPAPGADPNRDRCGALWFAPAVPMLGSDAAWCVQSAEETLLRHGFDANIGLNCFSDRVLDCTTLITYDRTIEGEDERALACYADLLRSFAKRGYYPYRIPLGMHDLAEPFKKGSLASRLKRALDPDGVLAGGRYLE